MLIRPGAPVDGDAPVAPGVAQRRTCVLAAAAPLLLGTSAFLRFVQPDEPGIAGADARFQAAWLVLYLAVAGLVLGRVVARRPLALPDRWLSGLVVLAAVSTAWSAHPEITARRSLALAGTALVGVLLASTWSFPAVLALLRRVITVAAVASLAIAASPAAHDRVHVEALRGVFFHRNGLGRAMAFGVLVVVLQAYLRRRVERADVGLVVVFGSLVVLSRSATGILLAGLSLVTPLALALLSRADLRLTLLGTGLLALAGAVALVGFAGVDFQDVTALAGRDASFTGRTTVWAAAADSIGERPALGHGFAGFWVGGYAPATRIASAAGFPGISQGHSGYVDVLLQLGLLGLAVLAGSLVVTTRRLWARVRDGDDRSAAAMGAVVAFIVVTNLSESSFQQHSFFMMVLFAVSAAAAATPPPTAGDPSPPVTAAGR